MASQAVERCYSNQPEIWFATSLQIVAGLSRGQDRAQTILCSAADSTTTLSAGLQLFPPWPRSGKVSGNKFLFSKISVQTGPALHGGVQGTSSDEGKGYSDPLSPGMRGTWAGNSLLNLRPWLALVELVLHAVDPRSSLGTPYGHLSSVRSGP